jgi:hypothetical protein
MAKSIVQVPSRLYAADVRTVNIPNLSTDDNGIQIVLTRESWPDTGAAVLSGTIEGTNDGGLTWFNLTTFSYAGGDQVNTRTGLPVTTCGPTVYWPESYDATARRSASPAGGARGDHEHGESADRDHFAGRLVAGAIVQAGYACRR